MHAKAKPASTTGASQPPTRRPVIDITGVRPIVLFTAVLVCMAAAALGVSDQLDLVGLLLVAEVWGRALLLVGPVWLAAWGLGTAVRWALRQRGGSAEALQPVTAQLAVGVASVLLLAWLLGHAGLLVQPVAWGLCAVPVALQLTVLVRGYLRRAAEMKHDPRMTSFRVHLPWTLPLLGAPVAMLMVASSCPPGTLWSVEAFGYDVTLYHLQAPLEWQQLGAIRGLEHNAYAYLPNLVEVGYLLLGTMRGSVREAVLASQVFHATLGLLAAGAIGQLVTRMTTAAIGVIAAAAALSLGWVLVTASMAYSEMGVLAMASASLLMLVGPGGTRRHGVTLAGALCGVATLCKLTAGVMVALPLGLMVLLRLNQATRWRPLTDMPTTTHLAGVMAIAGVIVLTPYLTRNALWTGNPVFPVAATTLGHGHWTPQLAERWDRAHSESLVEHTPLRSLARQWLMNGGYGAIGGYAAPRRAVDVAHFDREYGVPVFMIVAAACLVMAIRSKHTRRLALGMVLLVTVQVLAWFALTHMQSRFLVPTVLPLAVVFGLGIGAARSSLQTRKAGWVAPTLAIVVLVALQLTQLGLLLEQTRSFRDDQGNRVHLPPLQLVGQLPTEAQVRAFAATGEATTVSGHHLLNHRTDERHKTLLVADGSGLLWIRRDFAYQTPFDVNLLGELIRIHEGDPGDVTRALRERGFTHVWVHWSELDRLMQSYGFDPAVTPDSLNQLAASGWAPVFEMGRAITLYRLPRDTRPRYHPPPAAGGSAANE